MIQHKCSWLYDHVWFSNIFIIIIHVRLVIKQLNINASNNTRSGYGQEAQGPDKRQH